MTTISSKRIVLGITGSIAAYKACEIASTLSKSGVHVTPVLTESASHLIGAATLEGLTGNRVITQMFDPAQNVDIEHISVSTSADLFIVAPATANILGKAANGISDDWLSTALLVTQAPVLFAPAMNTNMYAHPAVQANIATLISRGNHFVGPDSGTLACKTEGPGRMSEPDEVVQAALQLLNTSQTLHGKKILITSGANHEPIDPVRYIGNRSSGKMGNAIACEALNRGADVTVVTGPADVAPPSSSNIISVQTALEMSNAVMENLKDVDVIIGAAAVADYRIENPGQEKHKRNGGCLDLKLVENPDIIANVGRAKSNGQLVIGFAAETQDITNNAQSKLTRKNLDLIVANEVGTPESGFGSETINAQFIDKSGEVEVMPLLNKSELAIKLFDRIEKMIAGQ
jgi:phosphopantothenoylcysteine decarboxylase/phosphopantothenate--cysteine ligase